MKVKFVPPCPSQFFSTVRNRVDAHFSESKHGRYANAPMWLKSAFFLSVFIGCYLLIIFQASSHPIVLLALAILQGMFSAFVGFNICHDAIHGSYSQNKAVNKILGFFFHLMRILKWRQD